MKRSILTGAILTIALASGSIVHRAKAQSFSGGPSEIASLRYGITVEPIILQPREIVTYTLTIQNRQGPADVLDSVRAVFTVPQLSDGRQLLNVDLLNLLRGPAPESIDKNTGTITWFWEKLLRNDRQADTIRFTMPLVELDSVSLQQCGENYVKADLEVTAFENGIRVTPGARSAESILDVRPDMFLEPPIEGPDGAQRGEILSFIIQYGNRGNVGDDAQICIKLPLGVNANSAEGMLGGLIVNKNLIPGVPDSVCFDLGLVESDTSTLRDFVLRFPITEHIPAEVMRVCFFARIISPCDTLAANDTLSNCYDIDPLDLLKITKGAAPTRVNVGDIVNYTLNYENVDSFVTAYNVRITDRLPLGVSFLSATPTAQLNNGVLLWRFDSLAPGESGTINYSVRFPLDFYRGRPDSIACRGMSISNLARIASDGPNGRPTPEAQSEMDNNVALIDVQVEPLTDLLAIAVDVDTIHANQTTGQLLPGDTLVFHLHFRNNSTLLPANFATLIDTLPDAAFATLLQPLPANYLYEAASNRIVRRNFTLAPLTADSVTFRVVIRSDIATCTDFIFINRAVVRDSLEFDCDLTNNHARDSFQIQATGDLLGIAVAAAPLTVTAATPVDFTLNYNNTGTIDALNVVVSDTLPAEIEFISATPAPSRTQGNVLFWDLGTLSRGASGLITVGARVRDNVFSCDSLLLQNRAGISSMPEDCSLGNNTASAGIILRTDPALQPQLVQQQIRFSDQNGDGCAEAGEVLTVEIDFVNQSQTTASILDLQNVLVSPGSLENFSFSHTTLPAGQTGTATLQIRAGVDDVTTNLRISGLLTAAGFCPRPINGVYCFKPRARVDMIGVDLTDLQSDRDDCAGEGEQLNIVFVYENTSPTRADSVDLSITIAPSGFAILSSNRPLTPAGASQALETRVTLEAGARDTLRLQIQYPDFTPQQFVVTVSATLQISVVSGFITPPLQDMLAICRECYARPNPFIPTAHPDGVRFAPNDGQNVDIFDLEGNKIRKLTTRDRWNGRDESGRECAAGVYIWVVEGNCRGTIILAK